MADNQTQTQFRGFKVVDGTKENFSTNDFFTGYVYLVRTDENKEDGYIFFNGKKYGTGKSVSEKLITDVKYVPVSDEHSLPYIDEDGVLCLTVAQGAIGVEGERGAQGAIGPDGYQGTQGIAGDRGFKGTQGSVGEGGDRGTQGIAGDRGFKGTQGSAGADGDQGTQGIAGDRGFKGTQGSVGEGGDRGTQGTAGDRGFKGTQGSVGEGGDRGTQGTAGDRGFKGTRGSVGEGGDRGTQGTAGDRGFKGTRGSAGADGDQGTQGIAGDRGFKGTRGSVGEGGDRGTQGTAGDRGFKGTRGSVGADGDQGTQGIAGDRGFKGTRGSVGEGGDRGTQGGAGLQGYTGTQGVVGATGDLCNLSEGAGSGGILVKSGEGWSGTIYTHTKASINSDGDISAHAFYEGSDERLKNFGQDIEIDFEKLIQLPKKYFTWKNPDVRGFDVEIGTSAQEVLKLYPELVSGNVNGNIDTDYLRVDYAKLSIIALAAIDKLYKKNTELEERLKTLENLILNK